MRADDISYRVLIITRAFATHSSNMATPHHRIVSRRSPVDGSRQTRPSAGHDEWPKGMEGLIVVGWTPV